MMLFDKMVSTKRASRSKMVIPVLFAMTTLGLVKAELTHKETDQRESDIPLPPIPGSDQVILSIFISLYVVVTIASDRLSIS
jgi:hypothetical protein